MSPPTTDTTINTTAVQSASASASQSTSPNLDPQPQPQPQPQPPHKQSHISTSPSPSPSHSPSDATLTSILRGTHILVGATGSVASVRVPRLLSLLQRHGAYVRLISTHRAGHFLSVEDELPAGVEHLTDADEWARWSRLSDPVLHIELRKWANLFIIAPTSANVLGKIANGLCDDLVTCVARAWPVQKKPMMIAPAMNTCMWDHPVTAKQIDSVQGFGIKVVHPIEKKLACGDIGVGAMELVERIVAAIAEELK